MIKIENIETYGWEAAIRGMRNPLNSWEKSDSRFDFYDCAAFSNTFGHVDVVIGENDHDLMMRLVKAGTEHRKFLRMVTVTMDITAPLYWWKEWDTYKVGTVANSCSTMHKLASRDLTINDFSTDNLMCDSYELLEGIIEHLNEYRRAFEEEGKKQNWWQLIQLLPSSYNQKRTVQLNYEVLAAMCRQRAGHKLDEWREFIEVVRRELPYPELFTGEVS